MVTGPEDKRPAARGYLRASHADREQVIGVLKAAFVQGRLAKDELDARVGRALASRTYAELSAITADIPAGVDAAGPARTRVRDPKAAMAATWVGLALALLAVAVLIGYGNDTERLIGVAVFFLPASGLALSGLLMFHSWLEKRSRGQLPQGPARSAGGQASLRLPSADPGRQLPPAGRRYTTEAARRRPVRAAVPHVART